MLLLLLLLLLLPFCSLFAFELAAFLLSDGEDWELEVGFDLGPDPLAATVDAVDVMDIFEDEGGLPKRPSGGDRGLSHIGALLLLFKVDEVGGNDGTSASASASAARETREMFAAAVTAVR